MTCVTAPAKILLTGVNGYVGAHVTKDLLDRGYTVVGTVRSSAKGNDIAKYFARYEGRFSYEIVRDISEPGAFDKMLSAGRFEGVAHTAAPVPPSTSNPSDVQSSKDMFNAATKGTLNILESIKVYGSTVKRVVFTSSNLAALQSQPGIKHGETHWNDDSVKLVEEKGDAATDFERYMASKCLSERAAWKFMEDNRSKISFDLVTVLPGAIIGAPINDSTPREQLGSANLLFAGLKSPRTEQQIFESFFSIVHVKNVASLHSEAFIHPEAAGHRVFAAVAEPSWQDILDALNQEPAFPGVPIGKPGVGSRPDAESLQWDMSLAKSLLGRNLIGAREMIRETANYYKQKGWVFV